MSTIIPDWLLNFSKKQLQGSRPSTRHLALQSSADDTSQHTLIADNAFEVVAKHHAVIGGLKSCCAGHPLSVDAIVKLDEDTIVTGSSDGIIRVLSIQPHNLLGVLAQQDDGGCERLALSGDQEMLATTSYGILRVWATSCLNEEDTGEGQAAGEQEVRNQVFTEYRFARQVQASDLGR